ncbi:MAG: hypothetical protein AAF688_05860 [Bacteroidota bacterium]
MIFRLCCILLFFCFLNSVDSQVYTEKQTRHRFAQMNFGFDLQSNIGGSTTFLNDANLLQTYEFGTSLVPRLLLGGTHFWGHADFYLAFPLGSGNYDFNNQSAKVRRGVETVFKYYPLAIEQGKIRPYIGTSIAPFSFKQDNNNFDFAEGPELNQTHFPLLAGLTYNKNNHLFELGAVYNYDGNQSYFISRTQTAEIEIPPLYLNLSYRYLIDTTLSAEDNWESGKTQQVTEVLAKEGGLNGFFIGAGISSAFWLEESDYNTTQRPYVAKNGIAVFPDFTLGYYLHKPDINFAFAYRGYTSSSEAYGASQEFSRRSLLFETTKNLFDYQGFVPFIGPAISYESLAFDERFEGTLTVEASDNKIAYGLTFGWDIRPNRIQSWTLRTNLRWFPNLSLDAGNSSVSFDNIEFNFIQLIVYPSRLF